MQTKDLFFERSVIPRCTINGVAQAPCLFIKTSLTTLLWNANTRIIAITGKDFDCYVNGSLNANTRIVAITGKTISFLCWLSRNANTRIIAIIGKWWFIKMSFVTDWWNVLRGREGRIPYPFTNRCRKNHSKSKGGLGGYGWRIRPQGLWGYA